VLIDIDIGSWASSQSTSGINLSAALVVVSGSFTATENGIPINSGDVDIYAWEEILDWEETLGWIGAALLQGFSNFNWTGNTCNWTFATEALSSATAVGIQITVGENYLTAKETISLHASDVVIPPKTYAFSSITGTIGSVTVNGQAPDSVSVYARAENGAYHAGSVSGTSWQIKGIDFSGTFAIGVRVEVEPGVYLHHDLATWTSGTSTSIAPLGDVSITSTSIGGTVTTNGTTALDQGALGVFSQSGTTLEDFYSQTLLGSAEITGGSFSGYVTNSSASGYVVIMVFGAQDPTYYVTSSAVPLNTSMNLNIAAMLQLGDD
jgi:hypothetical protein